MRRWFPLLLPASLVLAGCAAAPAGPEGSPPGPRPAGAEGAPAKSEKTTVAPEEVAVQTTAADWRQQVTDPTETLYQVLLAEIATHRGEYEVAVDTFLALARETRNVSLAERAARVAVYARRNDQALQAAQLWAELAEDSLEAQQVLTALYIREGDLDTAERHLEQVLTAADDAEAKDRFMLIAGLLGRQQDKQAALTVMRRLIDKRPEDAEAHYAYAHLAVRAGALDQAQTGVARVLELRPEWSDAIRLKARVLRMRGDTEAALAYLADQVDAYPEATDVRMAYAQLLMDQERAEQALEQFKEVAETRPGDSDVLLALGVLSLQLDRIEQAEEYLHQAVDTGRHVREASYFLGRIAEEKQNPDAAVKWYRKVDRGQNHLDAQVRIAVLLADQGEMALARSHLHTVQARGPNQWLRLHLAEGQILREHGRQQEAIKVYTQALEEMPRNKDLLYARAMTFQQLGQLQKMEADLRSILEREPDNAEVLNALGYTLTDETDRHQEAFELIKRALELEPESHFILDSMGWVHYHLGNHQKAVEFLRRALEIKMDPEIAAHLTEVLWVMGQEEQAREVWQRALQASPQDELLLEVMEQLDAR